ncbi:FUN14 domain-containing protein 1A isoform X1 [Pararge aegeria]|uniref:Jg11502 protein n=2 Tax=Pararge aegeria TaxID=116150 RepID=A0A8S4RJX9_9NEOP|nr:FUN14 domain-containing protein 1A isoform X1 [Pararge aegeria]CAH2238221.1 jg11502 [Pararge aegeria aegeria]
MAKPKKDETSEEAKKIVDDAKNFIEKAIADIGSTSATKQLILGTASGWITGFITMKIGKIAAVGIGGGVILLHIASQKGYIDVNWDKINKRVDKITDKIEKETTGKSPDWFDKVERFVDRKLDKAEGLLKKKEHKAKRWYNNFIGDDNYRATETHVFLTSFVAGMAIGLLCGK